MKKQIFFFSIIILAFFEANAQVEYKIITSVESIVPAGIGRSRLISVNEEKNYKDFKNLKYLIIDCLWYNFHPSHFNLEASLNIISKFKPKNSILTNLSPVLDYKVLKKLLPKNVVPGYDGMKIIL